MIHESEPLVDTTVSDERLDLGHATADVVILAWVFVFHHILQIVIESLHRDLELRSPHRILASTLVGVGSVLSAVVCDQAVGIHLSEHFGVPLKLSLSNF